MRRWGPLINISSLSSSSSFLLRHPHSHFVWLLLPVLLLLLLSFFLLSEQFSSSTCTHALLFAQAKRIIVIRSLLTSMRRRRELLLPAELIDVWIYVCFDSGTHLHRTIRKQTTKTDRSILDIQIHFLTDSFVIDVRYSDRFCFSCYLWMGKSTC